MNEQVSPSSQSNTKLPPGALILLPVRNMVLFPGVVMPLTVGRPRSQAAAQEALRGERPIGIVLQTDPTVDEPGDEQLHRIGTVAEILRYVTAPDGTHHLIVRGTRRFRIQSFLPGYPFVTAQVEEIGESEVLTPEIEGRVQLLRQRAHEAMQLLPNVPAELVAGLDGVQSASALADFVANLMDIKPSDKQDILETFDVKTRLEKTIRFLTERIQVLRISKEIGEQTQETLSTQQREHILREQMRQIQRQLGESDDRSAELEELKRAIESAGMPKEVEDQAKKELRRLERMPDAAGEYSMIRTYLDWLIELPWSKLADERIDIQEAQIGRAHV